MVDSLAHTPRSVVAYDHDSEISAGTIEDEKLKIFGDAAKAINEEAHAEDQTLREEQGLEPPSPEEPQEEAVEPIQEESPKEEKDLERPLLKKKKSHPDKRFEAVITKYAEAAQERDAYARRVQDLEQKLMVQQKKNLDDQIEYTSNLLEQAHAENDSKSFVEATQHLSQLSIKKSKVDEQLQSLQDHFQDNSEEPQRDPLFEERYHLLNHLSHPREKNTEDYQEWLERNPVMNPFSEDFDPDLAEKVGVVRREFNTYLALNQEQTMIGTEDYYDNLDTVIQNYLQNLYQSGNNQFYQEEPVQESRQPFQRSPLMNASRSSPPVSTVNRQGYQQAYSSNNLPPLTEFERQTALKSDFTDPATGRPLTDSEKISLWKTKKMEYLKETAHVR